MTTEVLLDDIETSPIALYAEIVNVFVLPTSTSIEAGETVILPSAYTLIGNNKKTANKINFIIYFYII